MATVRILLACLATLFGLAIILPLLVIAIPCVVISALVQVIAHVLEPRFSPWSTLLEFDPALGWKVKGSMHTYHLADDIFYVSTDADGWRGNRQIVDSDVVVFGDSFAWGYGIDDKHYFGNLAAPLRVKALGTMGYNMVQAFLLMQQASHQLNDKLVVWFIYYGNDLYENLVPHMQHYKMPFVREAHGSEEWEIVTHHVNMHPWPLAQEIHNKGRRYYEKLAELCSATFLAQRAYAACTFLIRQGRELCQAYGAHLVVMGIPDITQFSPQGIHYLRTLVLENQPVDPDYPDQQIRRVCQSLDVPFVTLKDHLTLHDHKQYDVHWNARGHRRVAEVLQSLYDEYSLPSHVASRTAIKTGHSW